MRFQVPQFIEVEDKIFGPLTLRQFIYLAGAAGILVVFWAIFPSLFLVFLFGAPVALLAIALAFLKINDRPFINALESAVSYGLKKRLYIWKKKEGKIVSKSKKKVVRSQAGALKVPTMSGSKLKDLAWSLDIKESIYSNKDQQN